MASGAGYDECIENIDIGGPAMIRAAAKNHAGVTVVVDAADYRTVLDEIEANGGATTLETRRALAAKAYARTGAYDAAISAWFAQELGETSPDFRAFGGRLIQVAALRREPAPGGKLLRHGGRPRRRRDRAPGPGQGTQLQQS